MDGHLLKEWIEKILEPSVEPDQYYLLIWDSFAPHKSESIVKSLQVTYDTEVVIIPGGCTSVVQPLGLGVNKPMKDRLKFCQWMTDRVNDAVSEKKSPRYIVFQLLA